MNFRVDLSYQIDLRKTGSPSSEAKRGNLQGGGDSFLLSNILSQSIIRIAGGDSRTTLTSIKKVQIASSKSSSVAEEEFYFWVFYKTPSVRFPLLKQGEPIMIELSFVYRF